MKGTTTKRTYKMGYGKLKHVKLFENFDVDKQSAEDLYKQILQKEKNAESLLNILVSSGISAEQFSKNEEIPTDAEIKDAYNFFKDDLIEIWSNNDELLQRLKQMNESKMNETGEWSRDMDLQAVKKMTDDEIGRDDEASWIKSLHDTLMEIKSQGVDLDIVDIKGHDKYQGPYAMVDFKKHGKYKVWTAEHDELFIENWPEGNNDRGFVGTLDEIVDLMKK